MQSQLKQIHQKVSYLDWAGRKKKKLKVFMVVIKIHWEKIRTVGCYCYNQPLQVFCSGRMQKLLRAVGVSHEPKIPQQQHLTRF